MTVFWKCFYFESFDERATYQTHLVADQCHQTLSITVGDKGGHHGVNNYENDNTTRKLVA